MNADKIKLEHEISSFIGTDNGATVHFEYFQEHLLKGFPNPGGQWTVSALTMNPKSGETFLLKECKADDELKNLKGYFDLCQRAKRNEFIYC
jgi:hypothetical protein